MDKDKKHVQLLWLALCIGIIALLLWLYSRKSPLETVTRDPMQSIAAVPGLLMPGMDYTTYNIIPFKPSEFTGYTESAPLYNFPSNDFPSFSLPEYDPWTFSNYFYDPYLVSFPATITIPDETGGCPCPKVCNVDNLTYSNTGALVSNNPYLYYYLNSNWLLG